MELIHKNPKSWQIAIKVVDVKPMLKGVSEGWWKLSDKIMYPYKGHKDPLSLQSPLTGLMQNT